LFLTIHVKRRRENRTKKEEEREEGERTQHGDGERIEDLGRERERETDVQGPSRIASLESRGFP